MTKVDMDKIIRKSLNESVDDLLLRTQQVNPESKQIQELIKEMATVIRLQHNLLQKVDTDGLEQDIQFLANLPVKMQNVTEEQWLKYCEIVERCKVDLTR